MFNAVFEKEQYYKFWNVEVIERVKNTTLREEAPKVAPYLQRGWNYYKLYLSSHDEMMKLIEEAEERAREREKCPWIISDEDLQIEP